MARSTIRSAPVPTFPLAKSVYDRDDESRFRSMVESALIDMTSSVERQLDGVLTFGGEGSISLVPGIVIGEAMDVAGQTFGTSVLFTALDFDTVQWTSGTVFLQDGSTVYNIDAGNTGNMGDNALRYIGLDVAISTTVLQVVTDLADLVGTGRILLGWAKRTGTGPAGRAAFVPTIGELGLSEEQLGVGSVTSVTIRDGAVIADSIAANVIQGLHIQANTIQGVNIQGNTITGTHINGTTLSAIFADLGTVTAGLIEANVIIASTRFSAATAEFDGNVTMTGNGSTLRVKGDVFFDLGSGSLIKIGGGRKVEFYESTNTLVGSIQGTDFAPGMRYSGDSEFTDDLATTVLVASVSLGLPVYTTAGLPATVAGHVVFDSTEGVFKVANGSSWDEPGGGGSGVTAVTGTLGVASSGGNTPNITMDADTLTELASGLLTGDHIVVADGTASKKALISAIPLSIFSNDQGWTSNAGTITAVLQGTGILVTGTAQRTVAIDTAVVATLANAQTFTGAKTFSATLAAAAITATSVVCTGEVTAFSASDERLKTAIWDITTPLDRLGRMRGVTFAWKKTRDPEFHKPRRAGLIAQEVRVALPEAVFEGEDGMLKMQYEQIIPLLVAGINELRAEVEELRDRC